MGLRVPTLDPKLSLNPTRTQQTVRCGRVRFKILGLGGIGRNASMWFKV